MLAANTRQVREALFDHGVTGEIDRFLEVLAEPDTIVGSSILIRT